MRRGPGAAGARLLRRGLHSIVSPIPGGAPACRRPCGAPCGLRLRLQPCLLSMSSSSPTLERRSPLSGVLMAGGQSTLRPAGSLECCGHFLLPAAAPRPGVSGTCGVSMTMGEGADEFGSLALMLATRPRPSVRERRVPRPSASGIVQATPEPRAPAATLCCSGEEVKCWRPQIFSLSEKLLQRTPRSYRRLGSSRPCIVEFSRRVGGTHRVIVNSGTRKELISAAARESALPRSIRAVHVSKFVREDGCAAPHSK